MPSNKMYAVLIARRLRLLRDLQQITQPELALQSHLSLRTIVDMEAGVRRNPGVLTLCRLARPLHANPGDLLNMWDPERPVVLPGGPLSADDLLLLYHPIDLMTVRTCMRCGHVSPPGEDHLAGGCMRLLYEAAHLRADMIGADLAKLFGVKRSVVDVMIDAEYGRHVISAGL